MIFKHKDATDKYGIDISKGRVDKLDRDIIKYALSYKGRKVVVDFGCGQSRLSAILALIGFELYLYDKQDLKKYFATLGNTFSLGNSIHFNKHDLMDTDINLPDEINIFISQRTMHYLPFKTTQILLHKVLIRMPIGGRLFMSLSSPNSKFVEKYPCVNNPVESRYCNIEGISKEIYAVNSQVCLYTKEDIHKLFDGIGAHLVSLKQTDFGNFQIIAEKRDDSKVLPY